MVSQKRNPGARPGATGARRPIEQNSRPNPTATRNDPQESARIDELLVRIGDRLRLGRLDGWALDFSKSIIGQAKRGGPRWRPTPRQLEVMEKIVAGPADDAPDEQLIEEIDP